MDGPDLRRQIRCRPALCTDKRSGGYAAGGGQRGTMVSTYFPESPGSDSGHDLEYVPALQRASGRVGDFSGKWNTDGLIAGRMAVGCSGQSAGSLPGIVGHGYRSFSWGMSLVTDKKPEKMNTSETSQYYLDDVATRLVQFAIVWAVLAMLVGVYIAAELVFPTLDFGPTLAVLWSPAPVTYQRHYFWLRRFGVDGHRILYGSKNLPHSPVCPEAGLGMLLWLAACGPAWRPVAFIRTYFIERSMRSWSGRSILPSRFLWVCFAIVFFGTVAKRTIRPIYVSNWFYGALIIVIAMLHIVNSLAIPVTFFKSYSLFAGAQDAMVQWWYGHNAVGFLLTGGFLGMLYYFLPKIANQPIWSYRLSVVSFWAFTYTYIWAGPHHMLYSAIPEWVQTLAMIMSLILLAPSWATMINGIMTVSKAPEKLKTDPSLKFIVLSLAFYGLGHF